jgi:LCP family protein required for cell wall assembly
MSATSPLRYPDTSSPKVMTTRAWWLVILNIVFPGSVQALAGSKRLGKIGMGATLVAWGFVILAVIVGSVWPTVFFFLGTWGPSLVVGQIALVLYALLWIVLTFDTLRLIRIVKAGPTARFWIAGVAVVALAAASGTAFYTSSLAGGLNSALGTIFVAGPAEPAVDGYYNFLLLGGDSGADREGLRPDTAQVISVNANTGQTTIIGLPRDLQDVPFSANSPMAKLYPTGYNQDTADYCTRWACLNTVFVDAELNHADLYPNAKKNGSTPGIEAMKEAAQGITGLTIQYSVLVDMQGMSDLVDALGGVDVNVSQRVAIATPDVPANQVAEWINVGPQHLDGYHAMMFARSRWGGLGDYDRMARQQQVEDAMIHQMNPATVLSKFQAIAKAGTQVMKTTVPQSMLGYFVELGLKAKNQPLVRVELTPANADFPVDTEFPDYKAIQKYITSVLHPPTPSASPKR